jgi:hypothetical protein
MSEEHTIRALKDAINTLVSVQSELGDRLAKSTAVLEGLPQMMAEQSKVVSQELAEQSRLLAELEVARVEASSDGRKGQLLAEQAHLREKQARLQEDCEVIRSRSEQVQMELTREANRRVRELDGEVLALIETDYRELVHANYSALYAKNTAQLRSHYAQRVDLRSELLGRSLRGLEERIQVTEAAIATAKDQVEGLLLGDEAPPEGEASLSVWRTVTFDLLESLQVQAGTGLKPLDEEMTTRLSSAVANAATRPLREGEIGGLLDRMRGFEPHAGATEQEWDEVVEEIGAVLREKPPEVFVGREA